MVRVLKSQIIEGNVSYIEAAGLSTDTDTMPENVATGSLFLEVDTGDVYSYDETGSEWYKIAALLVGDSGSGGGVK